MISHLSITSDSDRKYPKPKVGYYQAECCLLDLYKIEDQDDLEDVESRIACNDENGPLMVFATLADAIASLAKYNDEDERIEQFNRLGWTGTDVATENS